MKKTLSMISSAYRAIAEEQDDTIVWLNHAMKGAGAELTVLLKDSAVNYLVKGQKVPALQFGNWKQTHPPQIQRDIVLLLEKGVPVYCVEDDLRERGLAETEILHGIQKIPRADLPILFAQFELIHQW